MQVCDRCHRKLDGTQPRFELGLTEVVAVNVGEATLPTMRWDLCEVCAMKVNTFLRPLPSEIDRERRTTMATDVRQPVEADSSGDILTMRHVSVKD